jgi:hypothetical protein
VEALPAGVAADLSHDSATEHAAAELNKDAEIRDAGLSLAEFRKLL